MAAINIYPRYGNDFSNYFTDVCTICSKVHHLYSPNAFMCYGAGMPGTDMAPTVMGTDLPTGIYRAVAWNGSNLFGAVGIAQAATSAAGTTWANKTMPPQGSSPKGLLDMNGIVWNGSLYCVVGTDFAMTSTDGSVGTFRNIGAGQWTAVGYNTGVNNLFVAVSYDGKCKTSPDGTTWTSRTIPAGKYLAVAWNGSNLWCAVGVGVCATSSDGLTWTAQTGIPALTFKGIAFGNSVFCAVGNGVAYTSADGVAWASRTIGAGNWQAIQWNATNLFCAVGTASACATSADGTTWAAQASLLANAPGDYFAICYNGSNLWVAVGDRVCATAVAGVTWTSRTIPTGARATLLAGSVVET